MRPTKVQKWKFKTESDKPHYEIIIRKLIYSFKQYLCVCVHLCVHSSCNYYE